MSLGRKLVREALEKIEYVVKYRVKDRESISAMYKNRADAKDFAADIMQQPGYKSHEIIPVGAPDKFDKYNTWKRLDN